MSGTEHAVSAARAPMPLLFLVANTGGGHLNAARAVGQALDRLYPGTFAPVLCNPLSGQESARLLRWVTGLYGPAIRLAPWLWGAAYHACNSRPVMELLRRTLLRLADGPAAAAVAAHRPAAIVSFHPLTGMAAVSARDHGMPGAPVVTVVTDLATLHASWRHADADLVIAPHATARGHGQVARDPAVARSDGGPGPGRPDRPRDTARGRWAPAWLPVTRDFWGGPLQPGERVILRRSLGLSDRRLLIVLTGGGEGCGGIARRAAAILRRFTDVDVVAVCGRNLRLKNRLDRLASRSGGRLTVTGFTHNMADWLRCADLVVTKAGPGTIAEATCCGAPLLLTSHVPGQERGNIELVAAAAAGRRVPGVRRLIAEIGRLHGDHAAIGAMRAASARLGRPGAAADIAALIAGLVQVEPATRVAAQAGNHAAAPAGAAGRSAGSGSGSGHEAHSATGGNTR